MRKYIRRMIRETTGRITRMTSRAGFRNTSKHERDDNNDGNHEDEGDNAEEPWRMRIETRGWGLGLQVRVCMST